MADLGVDPIDRNKLYRCLVKASEQEYRKIISQACLEHVQRTDLTLVLYDVTTLYFEVQKEDDYRKPGMSKERRLEPQIIMGLLVDRNGWDAHFNTIHHRGTETQRNAFRTVLCEYRYGARLVLFCFGSECGDVRWRGTTTSTHNVHPAAGHEFADELGGDLR